jgi:hypothetical protein
MLQPPLALFEAFTLSVIILRFFNTGSRHHLEIFGGRRRLLLFIMRRARDRHLCRRTFSVAVHISRTAIPSFVILTASTTPSYLSNRDNDNGNVIRSTSAVRKVYQDLVSVIEGILPNDIENLVVVDKVVETIRAEDVDIPLLWAFRFVATLYQHFCERTERTGKHVRNGMMRCILGRYRT